MAGYTVGSAAMPELSLNEFARRLCAVDHPLFSTTGANVPCGTHINQATHLMVLTSERGTGALRVVNEARAQQGIK